MTTLNNETLRKLILEDIDWLENRCPRSPELYHTVEVLKEYIKTNIDPFLVACPDLPPTDNL